MEMELGGGAEGEAPVERLEVRNFLAARIQEINSLSNQISLSGIPQSKGLAFQHVPKHMRRRAVSHNPKRLPKRLQRVHLNQVEKSSGIAKALTKKPKKPSRKHRRRPANLLDEYNRRQRENQWLETHIWHAKRFHMENRWGYRIPFCPTDKGFRAAYKAARRHCVMRDISFYSCLELRGPFLLLSSTISSFAPKEANPISPSSLFYRNGGREGVLHFYQRGTYPLGYIGRVRFHWGHDSNILFLWTHPAQKEEILTELCSEFELLSTEKMSFSQDDTMQSEMRPLSRRRTWTNYTSKVTLKDLEGELNRLRFYGPLATRTLKEVLQVLSWDKVSSANHEAPSHWWTDHFKERESLLNKQKVFWDTLLILSQVPSGAIIPLTVVDPRVTIPQKREPLPSNNGDEDSLVEDSLDSVISDLQLITGESPLLHDDMRMRVVKEKMSQAEFDKRRAKLLIPGTKLDLGHEENQIPILLIHRSSSSATRFDDGGWDLVLPANWTMPFWIAFVFRCVRAVGLRESQHYEFESGSLLNSNEDGHLPPDSHSGLLQAKEESLSLESNYFKYPPAKRVNYLKLSCPFPFKINWKALLRLNNRTESSCDDVYVLRDPSLKSLKDPLTPCLVSVRLTINGKGCVGPGAVICLPLESDMAMGQSHQIEEPLVEDLEAQKARATLTNERDKLKKFLQSKRKKLRRKGGSENDLVPFSSEKLHEINRRIDQLWLPENEEAVLRSLTRKPIGFLMAGRESYSVGKCSGLGYCSYQALGQFLETSVEWNPKRLVLVRDCRRSLIYRWAKIEVCL